MIGYCEVAQSILKRSGLQERQIVLAIGVMRMTMQVNLH
jgi:hypothetical protein